MMATPVEFRAKRTHARRSCDLCKLRKTRCELPDLDVAPGPDPQPFDKACHRCQVLSLPCVVDDAKGKQRRKDTNTTTTGESSQTQGHSRSRAESLGAAKPSRPPSPKRRKSSRASFVSGDAGSGPSDEGSAGGGGLVGRTLGAAVNDSLELMQSFDEEVEPALRKPSAASTPTGFGVIPGSRSGNWEIERTRSMRFHGRPMELVAAMLTLAYGRIRTLAPRPAFTSAPDFDRLVDESMRQRLEAGYSKLRTYHPHLEKMSSLFAAPVEDASPSRSLLLSLVAYLSTLAMPASSGQRLRDTLTPYIYALRDAVLQQLPCTFATLQALEILSAHAPFGVLPLDTTNLSSLALARGVVQAAAAVAVELNASLMIRTMSRVGHVHTWLATDTWTWLSSCAAEAASRLEDETPRAPPSLAEARGIAELFYEREDMDVWRKGIALVDEAEFTGRIYMCDRLLHLAEVLDCVTRSRGVMETAAKDPSFDSTSAMDAEFRFALSRLDELDQKFQTVYALLPVKTAVATGWAAYRQYRGWFAAIRVYEVGLRYTLALQLLHDAGAPQVHTSSSKVSAAINRAFNPAEVMPLIEDGTQAHTAIIWHYGRERAAVAERIVAACPKILEGFLQPGVYSLAPTFDTMSIMIESAKNLLESQAWKIAVYRIHRPILHEARHPPWIESMRAASNTMSRLATFAGSPSYKGLEPVANGCANIVASMMRVAIERSVMLDSNPETASDDPPPQHNQQIPQLQLQQEWQQQMQELEHHQLDSSLDPIHPRLAIPVYDHNNQHNGAHPGPSWQQQQQQHPQQQQQQQVILSPHDYMNTSDRWMAGPATTQPSHSQQYDTNHPVQPSTGYPVMIDQILSEAFSYSYEAPPPPPPPQQQNHQPPTQVYGNENGQWPNGQ